MGHVFRATNELVGRTVAIKVLRSEHATNASIVERFLREARAANLVRHPNVVDVLDVGSDADGAPFIVQELLLGEDLAKYVERRGGRLELGEIGEYILPVIEAVAEAHARGVVHRDIKPENVFLAESGSKRVPKLLDFGISKIRLPGVRTTDVGVMMGTPAYMAPEQIQGGQGADPRSDVWALGIVLYELLSGRHPFPSHEAPAMFVAIVTEDVPPLASAMPTVSPALARVVERCLRRNRDERYATALELARDLRHVLDGTEIEPTDRRLPVAAAVPDLVIPDLPVPPRKVSKAAPTVRGPAPVNHVAVADPSAPAPAPPSPPDPSAPAPAPPSRPAPTASPRPSVAEVQPLPGVILSGASHSPSVRRPASLVSERKPSPPVPDMSFLVGIAVVGLTAIGSTAVLMALAHQPEGFSPLGLVTKPTPMMSLLVHGGLALAGFVLTARITAGAVKRWGSERGGALASAVFAGAILFAAIEIARAAF
jgi:serine/threonine-protein kinase